MKKLVSFICLTGTYAAFAALAIDVCTWTGAEDGFWTNANIWAEALPLPVASMVPRLLGRMIFKLASSVAFTFKSILKLLFFFSSFSTSSSSSAALLMNTIKSLSFTLADLLSGMVRLVP